ncbi:MAG: hypothetical protein HQL17_01135 [Candidatus Omnitrophica bacterium]|nr:hypothetical protein [Candidatus Omnitrophota bacterium]
MTNHKKYLGKIMAAICITGILGCGSPFKYEKYISQDALLNITMDMLSGWTPRETRGASASYLQVSFVPPPTSKEALLSITVKDTAHIGTRDDLNAVTDDLLAKRHEMAGFKLEKRAESSLLGQPAVMLEMSYKTLMSMARNAPLTPVHEKMLITRIKDNFYFFRYQNTTEKFAALEPAFAHMAKSLHTK